MKKYSFLFGSAFLAGFFAILFVFVPVSVQAKNIKVGIIDCYTGPAAVYGKDALNGFKLAVEEINKTGVLGKKI